jgi:hypothetical protein
MSYTLPPSTPATPPPANSNRTLWIVLGAIGFVGVCLLLCAAIGIIGVLTLLGQQTSAVFRDIEQELNPVPQFELPTTQPADLSAAVPVGTMQRIGNLEITVTGARFIEDEAANQPEPGYRYVAVEVRIANQSAQPIVLEAVSIWTWLQDQDNFTYDCCVYALSKPELFTDSLPAGGSVEGELVYEVLDDVGSLYWVYDDSAANARMAVELQQLIADTDRAQARQ